MERGGDVARSLFNIGHMPWDKWNVAKNNAIMEQKLVSNVENAFQAGKPDATAAKKTTLLNQALKYLEQESGQAVDSTAALDKESFRFLMSNLKVLILAGFETTSGILCWMFKELQDSPESMAKLRAEHDAVFGSDTSKTAEIIKTSPHLLQSIPYTAAVVKETLRLHPLTFAIRQGTAGKSCKRKKEMLHRQSVDYLLTCSRRLQSDCPWIHTPISYSGIRDMGRHRLDPAESCALALAQRFHPRALA